MACLSSIIDNPEFAIRLLDQETFQRSPLALAKLVVQVPASLKWTTKLSWLFLLSNLEDFLIVPRRRRAEDLIHCLNCRIAQPFRHRWRCCRGYRAEHSTGSKLTHDAIALDQVLGLGQVWPTQEHRHDCQESWPLSRSYLPRGETAVAIQSLFKGLHCSRNGFYNASEFWSKCWQSLSPCADGIYYKRHIRLRPRPRGKGWWEGGWLVHMLLRSQTWRQKMVKASPRPRGVALAAKSCIDGRTFSPCNGNRPQELPLHTS